MTNEKELIDAIISAYHTTRLSQVGVAAHILSNPNVRNRLAETGPPRRLKATEKNRARRPYKRKQP
jgi:hypothetical protein